MVRLLIAKYSAARKFFTGKEEGASMVEYGLLLALIAMVVAAAAATLGTAISTFYTDVAGSV